MLRQSPLGFLRWLVFGALLVFVASVRESPDSALDMAVIWLPTGVAVAGVFTLGNRAALVVALATLVQRWNLGYDWTVGITAAAGSASEAMLGAYVLRRFEVARPPARLRDIGIIVLAAMVAPLGSIFFSAIGRSWVWLVPSMPFYSGWDGWWRMNALAVVIVVPAVLTWTEVPAQRFTPRFVGRVATGVCLFSAALLLLMALLPQSATGVMWLNLVLIGAVVLAAARYGMRGATLATLVGSLLVVVGTTRGWGPFLGVPRAERHVVLQLFELALAALPPAFAAIVGERRSAQAATRRTEALLESIGRNVQEGLFRTGPALELQYANDGLARMLGHDSPDAVLGRSLADAIVSPERRQEVTTLLREQGRVQNEEVQMARADGTQFWGLLSGVAVQDARGGRMHYDGAVADITARKALEEQFRQSHKMEAVGQLAGGIAHDFNNLLTVVLGYTELLRDGAPDGAPARDHAAAVHEAATRAAGLTRQLLAYSRRQVLSPQVLEITDVVNQMAAMLQRLIREDIRLVVAHRSGPCWVRVDRSQLEQVLLNLAINARDAMAAGGTLTISTEAESWETDSPAVDGTGPSVMVRVHDTGVGMAPDTLTRAFEPFFTTKPIGQGTGLGLATVYGIVKQSGGAVWLDSRPGEGTTACVALPRWTGPAALPASPAESASGVRSGTVLVVEDEPAVRRLITQTLAARGWRVLEAADGTRALELADTVNGRYDMVVTDVVMPNMGGRDLVRHLARRWPGRPILFVSGHADGALTPADLAESGAQLLPKPFSPEQLSRHVEILASRGDATA